MAGAKGYSSYRGRGSKWKVFMAILLVLVILAAASVIYLEQHIVYSSGGRRQIVLPWQSEEADAAPVGDQQGAENRPNVEVVVEPPKEEEPQEILARALPAAALTRAVWAEFEAGMAADSAMGTCNAVVVRLKTSNGTVYFESANAVSGAVQVAGDPGETASILNLVTSREGLHAIASMSCLQDFKAANADVEGRGLKNTGGYIFYDGNNSLWLDPCKPSAREYVCALAKEIAELGFDELLLTDFSYPTVGKINKIFYKTDVPRSEEHTSELQSH